MDDHDDDDDDDYLHERGREARARRSAVFGQCLSQIYLSHILSPERLLRFLGILVVIQVLIPHYYVGGTMLEPHFPLIISFFLSAWLNVP